MYLRKIVIALSIGTLAALGLAAYGGMASATSSTTQIDSGQQRQALASESPKKSKSASPSKTKTKSPTATPSALPKTGSGGSVPTIAAVGGGMVVLGLGVLVGLRRRRDATTS
jgi:LPXTG-motif cell wall-anchored protein